MQCCAVVTAFECIGTATLPAMTGPSVAAAALLEPEPVCLDANAVHETDRGSRPQNREDFDDLYSLDDINNSPVTFKRSAKVSDDFNVYSVNIFKILVSFDLFDKKKQFRLKKNITTTKKQKTVGLIKR